jgi:transposase
VAKMDYSGKDVYIGIDVHKRTYSVSCVCEGQLVKRATMPASGESLFAFIGNFFVAARIHSAYEAGLFGFTLHRFLVAHGIDNIVVNPASIEIAARDKVKTDRRDSLKIATQLSAGRLRGIYVPSEKLERQRLITRTREQLVQQRTRLALQFKARLFLFGLIPADDRRAVSKRFIAEHLDCELPEELSIVLSTIARLWSTLNDEINRFARLLAEQGKEDARVTAIYSSLPGAGPVTVRTLANELSDMSQFKNERGLFSFLGLTPWEFSSGDSRRLGHISRQGSARLRAILIEAAWRAIKKDPALEQIYRRIATRAGAKRAIVAIARKLTGRIRACFRKAEGYKLGYGMAA